MKTFIIAEGGINHDGSLQSALALVDAAKAASANAVKFQTSIPEEEASARYVPDHLADIKRWTLSWDDLMRVAEFCKSAGIEFMCTAADRLSLRTLVHMRSPLFGVQRIKIGSDNLCNLPYLEEAAASGLPIILSTGMADWGDVAVAMETLGARDVGDTSYFRVVRPYTNVPIALLHCTSSYPCSVGDANIALIPALQSVHPHHVIGWSDHTTSVTLPVAAVAMGARIIEKHLTLNRWRQGPDHAASLEPHEFRQMVNSIREFEAAVGTPDKDVLPCEQVNRAQMGKSLMAAVPISKGQVIEANMLAVKRPGTGVSPARFYDMVGGIAGRDYERDEMIDAWVAAR